MMNSKTYYDGIGPQYESISGQKDLYLLGIERVILDAMSNKPLDGYLDIGCGNGTRSHRIIKSLNPERSVLLDESHSMIEQARKIADEKIKVIEADFLTYDFGESFNLMTCLWNVLGHLDTRTKRLEFLKRMYQVGRDGATIFLDVNNRYNVRHYGIGNVASNVARDLFSKKGSGVFQLRFGDDTSSVYIHNPFELDNLIREAGFKKFNKYFIDYKSGSARSGFFSGQVLYQIHK